LLRAKSRRAISRKKVDIVEWNSFEEHELSVETVGPAVDEYQWV
jgi:hypothetical protein